MRRGLRSASAGLLLQVVASAVASVQLRAVRDATVVVNQDGGQADVNFLSRKFRRALGLLLGAE